MKASPKKYYIILIGLFTIIKSLFFIFTFHKCMFLRDCLLTYSDLFSNLAMIVKINIFGNDWDKKKKNLIWI
jgi:hypothetical protein